jgi:hypothetical protein
MMNQRLIVLLLGLGAGISVPSLMALEPPAPAAREPVYMIILGKPETFSKQYPAMPADRDRQIGFGVVIKMLNTPREAIRQQVAAALDQAETTGYPVLIHVDDWNFTPPEWKDPEIVEWTAFPEPGERFGPPVKRRWINWGSWRVVGPPPNVESSKFREYARERLEKDIAGPIALRLKRWKTEGRSYLFAGLVVGWETGFYTADTINLKNRPTSGEQTFGDDERVRTGYAALTARGYTAADITERAQREGKTRNAVMNELMWGALHDYSEYLCDISRRAGLPRERIYTHYTAIGTVPDRGKIHDEGMSAPLPTAANPSSRPGYTMTFQWFDRGVMEKTLAKMGCSEWGAVEVEITKATRSEPAALAHFDWLTKHGAKVICLYGWREKPDSIFAIQSTGAVPAIRRWLAGE